MYSASAPLVPPYGQLAKSINTTTPLSVSRWDAGIIPTDASGSPLTSTAGAVATSALSGTVLGIPVLAWLGVGALVFFGRKSRRR